MKFCFKTPWTANWITFRWKICHKMRMSPANQMSDFLWCKHTQIFRIKFTFGFFSEATSCFPGSLWNGAMCIQSDPYMKNWFAMQLPSFECTESLKMYWLIFKFLPFEPEIIQLKPICWSFFGNTPFFSYFGGILYALTFFFRYFCMRTKLCYEWKSLSNQLNQAKVSKNFFVSFLISHEETTILLIIFGHLHTFELVLQVFKRTSHKFCNKWTMFALSIWMFVWKFGRKVP